MEKDEIKKETTKGTLNGELICSKCHKSLSKGDFYNLDVISKEITCIGCQDNRILIDNENFLAIEDK